MEYVTRIQQAAPGSVTVLMATLACCVRDKCATQTHVYMVEHVLAKQIPMDLFAYVHMENVVLFVKRMFT